MVATRANRAVARTAAAVLSGRLACTPAGGDLVLGPVLPGLLDRGEERCQRAAHYHRGAESGERAEEARAGAVQRRRSDKA